MSDIPVMCANHMNRTLEYFLYSLVLNVYVGVSVCGSSGRLHVLNPPLFMSYIRSYVYTPNILSCEKRSRFGWPQFCFSCYSHFLKPLVDHFKVCVHIFVVLRFEDIFFCSFHHRRTEKKTELF